jgi:hypothetical protein
MLVTILTFLCSLDLSVIVFSWQTLFLISDIGQDGSGNFDNKTGNFIFQVNCHEHFIFMQNLLSLVEGWGYCIVNILG